MAKTGNVQVEVRVSFVTPYWCDGCGVRHSNLPAVKRALSVEGPRLAFHSYLCYLRARESAEGHTLKLPVVPG